MPHILSHMFISFAVSNQLSYKRQIILQL